VVVNETFEVAIELILQSFLGVVDGHVVEHDGEVSSREVLLVDHPLILLPEAERDKLQQPPQQRGEHDEEALDAQQHAQECVGGGVHHAGSVGHFPWHCGEGEGLRGLDDANVQR
jgi:hypothetical protein